MHFNIEDNYPKRYAQLEVMDYKVTRTCKKCKNEDSFALSKFDAAFEEYDSNLYWNKSCSKCGSKKCYSLSHHRPELDKEILDIWGKNSKLTLMQQDEEFILSEVEFLPMIINAIDNSEYLDSKINTLLQVVCIMLYDQTIAPEEFTKKENQERELIAKKIRPELIKRKSRIIAIRDSIDDYIKEEVFPQIGIK